MGSQAATPEQQCKVVSHWMSLALGVLAPLALLWQLERAARATCLRHLRRVGCGSAPLAQQLAAEAAVWEASEGESVHSWLSSPARLYLLTCLLWLAAHAL